MPQLLASLGQKLEQVPIRICSQNHCSHRLQLFRSGPPPQCVNRSVRVGLLVLDVGVEFCDFGVFEEVIDANVSIAGGAGEEGVFVCKLGEHDFSFVLDGYLEVEFLFELYFFEDASLGRRY